MSSRDAHLLILNTFKVHHRIRTAQTLYEANIQCPTTDLNVAWIDADEKQERVTDFKEKIENQAEAQCLDEEYKAGDNKIECVILK